MIETKNIKAILFDSGRVLNEPRTGNWFISPNFHKYVDMNKFKMLDIVTLQRAFNEGKKYLDGHPLILTELEEFTHFVEFYRIISKEIKESELTETQILSIAQDTVYNDEKFLFYEDVFQVIPQLSQNYKLGIVSDTWPSLERVFRNVGLREYFSTFVMSSVLGVSKPHELMFKTALSELNIEPEEALFIDDNISNVEGARRLGIESILMLRNNKFNEDNQTYSINTSSISNLNELQEILDTGDIASYVNCMCRE